MCCSKNRLRVKLGDFGLASILPPGEIAVARPQLFGSALYTPPEETSSFAADMWASGITCYVIMSGNFPFGTPAEARTLAPSFCASCWQRASPLVPDFIRDLLHRKPEHRPSVAEALLHPWLSSPGGARVHHGPRTVGQRRRRDVEVLLSPRRGEHEVVRRVCWDGAGAGAGAATDPRKGLVAAPTDARRGFGSPM